jgi:hypothetical protein
MQALGAVKNWLCVTLTPHKTDCDRAQIVLEFATASFTL